MAFTVYHPGGARDVEFNDYARLLRYRGADLGKVPRVRDPITESRWLYVWPDRSEAQEFAEELKNDTNDPGWEVLEVNGQTSEGPLGPFVVQLARRGDRLLFALTPLSRVLIRSAYPQAVPAVTYATIDKQTWDEYRRTKGGLDTLVQEIIPTLTGLNHEQLDTLGYVVLDEDTYETRVKVPPALPSQV
jgi:hypothetical protein